MKKLVLVLFLGLMMNSSFAGYGEDMKGECVKGKDSSRGQAEVVVEETSSSESSEESKSLDK